MELKETLLSSFLAFDAEDGPQNKLQKHRRDAIEVFENQGFPTKKLEDWKYTSLRGLTKESFSVFPKKTPRPPRAVESPANRVIRKGIKYEYSIKLDLIF